MLIMSTLARQKGKPLMLFNTTWSTPSGKHKAALVALTLGVVDALNKWSPTTESEDTMNRMNDILPAGWPYTIAVIEPGEDAHMAIETALMKTPKNCGLVLCACAVNDYKLLFAALNVQQNRQLV